MKREQRFFHSLSSEGDLPKIMESGYLRGPVYVWAEGVPPPFLWGKTVLELDFTGFRLLKDRHPKALEGYYYTKGNVPTDRIVDVVRRTEEQHTADTDAY